MKKQEDYYKEIISLAKYVRGYARLSTDDKQTVVSDVYVKLFFMWSTGSLVCDDFEKYKGFMFISIKNAVLNVYFKKNHTKKGRGQNTFIDENLKSIIQPTNEISIDSYFIKKFLNNLSPVDRAILRWNLRGWSLSYITKALNTTRAKLNLKIKKIRASLTVGLLGNKNK